MAILTVGPNSTYPTIADAMLVANPSDQISLESGYSNEVAAVTVDNMFVTGDSFSTNIRLHLATGIGAVTLQGNAPINVFDNAGNNTITGNDGANFVFVTQGTDVAHGGLGIDRLSVDYHDATGDITGTVTSITDGGAHSVTYDGFENVTVATGSGNDTLTLGDGLNKIYSGTGNDTITAGNGDNLIQSSSGNDTVTTGNGDNNVDSGSGNDTITTGTGQDIIVSGWGDDTVIAGAGNDLIFGDRGVDTVNAGAGVDRLTLDYSQSTSNVTGGVTGGTLAAGYTGTIADVAGTSSTVFTTTENLTVTTGTGDDNIVAGDGDDFLTGGSGMDTLSGRGGMDTLVGGDGMDTLKGATGADTLTGGANADYLTGGLDADTYVYLGVSDSTGLDHDIIHGFDAPEDHFDLDVSVTGVNRAVRSGHLDDTNFDTDLTAATSTLQANHAMMFYADSGSDAGKAYVVIDANGVAGYQAGQDYVMELESGYHLGALSTSDFI